MRIKKLFEKLDNEKLEIFKNENVAFSLEVMDTKTRTYAHTGMGTGGDMTFLALLILRDLYNASGGVELEAFAESVKSSLIKFVEDEEKTKGH